MQDGYEISSSHIAHAALASGLELYFATFGASISFLGSRGRYTEALEPLSTRCSAVAAAAIGLSFAGEESQREADEVL